MKRYAVSCNRSLTLFTVSFAFWLSTSPASGANGLFIRTDSTFPDATAHAVANANFPPTTDSQGTSDESETIARAEGNGTVSIDLAFATAHAETTAVSLAPVGTQTYAAQVNVSSFHSGYASAEWEVIGESGVGTDATAWMPRNFNNATASGEFTLNLPDETPQGEFHGFVYVTAHGGAVKTGTGSNVQIEDGTSVGSSVSVGGATYSAIATWDQISQVWNLSVNLGATVINDAVASLNHHFQFVAPVTDGQTISIGASNSIGVLATVASGPSDNPTASIQLGTVGAAWGIVTPTDGGPLPGDFDGDGDVDNDDFEIWNDNNGTGPGAIGPQGDADLDGNVDFDDLVIWLENTVTPGIPGDYNGDNSVDAADYTLWRDMLGSDTDLQADGNFNGVVDAPDYDVWKSHFGIALPSGAGQLSIAAVPEPYSVMLAVVSVLGLSAMIQRIRREKLFN